MKRFGQYSPTSISEPVQQHVLNAGELRAFEQRRADPYDGLREYWKEKLCREDVEAALDAVADFLDEALLAERFANFDEAVAKFSEVAQPLEDHVEMAMLILMVSHGYSSAPRAKLLDDLEECLVRTAGVDAAQAHLHGLER